jgi:hypothetical protein
MGQGDPGGPLSYDDIYANLRCQEKIRVPNGVSPQVAGLMLVVLGWWTMNTPPRWRHKKPTAWAPEQIVIGALVFGFGLLIGAGVAVLLRPS